MDAGKIRLCKTQIRALVKLKYNSAALGFLRSLFLLALTIVVGCFVFDIMMRFNAEHCFFYLLSGIFLWHFFSNAVMIKSDALNIVKIPNMMANKPESLEVLSETDLNRLDRTSAPAKERDVFEAENAALKAEKSRLSLRVSELEESLKWHVAAEMRVVEYLRGFTKDGSARLANWAKHVQRQLFGGGWQGKKDFCRWFVNALRRKNSPDPAFNPLWNVYDTARRSFMHPIENPTDVMSQSGEHLQFDVLFFSMIEYTFRYQRPQQIADYYARQGHRVFYFRPMFDIGDHPDVRQIHENLFEVVLCFKSARNIYVSTFDDVEDDLSRQLDEVVRKFSIRDAISISEYPNWVNAVRLLKHRYPMVAVLDYLDDWDGFEGTATPEVRRNTRDIFEASDCVVASSTYLAEKAGRCCKNVVTIRNGTEFSHFNRAYKVCEPGQKGKKKIGYYGAISHWFDVGKICALARGLPDVEIELIGEVSAKARVDPAKRFTNVHFLGEKVYVDLPDLIKGWDVCLIPFDTSTNLIKATNPVKFYEYLSAGKKVVATEIPELLEFRGKFALLANDDETFVRHVKSCLDGDDGLAIPEERIRFAQDNDWDCRLNAINEVVMAARSAVRSRQEGQ